MAKRLGITAKRLAISAKEASVWARAEIKGRLWEAFPLLLDENRKGWCHRVARDLTQLARTAGFTGVQVTPRRIRAVMNGEARRIDHVEVRLIELRERIKEIEQRSVEHRGELNDIAIGIATARADARAAAGRGGTSAGDRAREGARARGGDQASQRGLRQAQAPNAAVRRLKR